MPLQTGTRDWVHGGYLPIAIPMKTKWITLSWNEPQYERLKQVATALDATPEALIQRLTEEWLEKQDVQPSPVSDNSERD